MLDPKELEHANVVCKWFIVQWFHPFSTVEICLDIEGG